MRILVLTNLYPPQELGGYGRCISDFVWGLLENVIISVLSSNAPYLAPSSDRGPNNEFVDRSLLLKGSFESGLYIELDESKNKTVDTCNRRILHETFKTSWDACLLGNIDLIGSSIIHYLSEYNIPILHHVGFVVPPYPLNEYPSYPRYSIASASNCVRKSLLNYGFPLHSSPVIYPGVRVDLFSRISDLPSQAIRHSLTQHNSSFRLGSACNPLKIGYAGLIMSSKGLHTLIQAVVKLLNSGIHIDVGIAGASYQEEYSHYLSSMIKHLCLDHRFHFFGQLSRQSLIKFWSLQHIGVFPSIQPEAFGIAAAEIMCSGLVLVFNGGWWRL